MIDFINRLKTSDPPKFSSDQQVLILLIGIVLLAISVWRFYNLY